MKQPPASYEALGGKRLPAGFTLWNSPEPADQDWDDFLRAVPSGQYQQSSLWSRFKASEAWRCQRTILMHDDAVSGGFQILWRSKGPLRFGYVSKGPVARPGDAAALGLLQEQLAAQAGRLGLAALIVQLPDDTPAGSASAANPAFIRSNPLKVIEATYLVDVHEDMETIRRRMHRNVRQCVRKAREQGVTVRTGTADDLPKFFDLMSATCRRQGTAPNPSSLAGLRLLWQLFSPSGSVELAFAGKDGTDIAGRMNFIFGRRVTQWKKGWDGSNPSWHPNELLADHALEWAHARGFLICDFSAMNRRTAERIMAGEGTSVEMARSRDMFNLRLGGRPQLLPRAEVYVPNPLLRLGYRHLYLRWEKRRQQATTPKQA